MRAFDNLKLAVKLPILLGCLSLIALLAMAYTGYHVARVALMDAGVKRINTAVNSKLLELEDWFDGVESDLTSDAQSPHTVGAIRDFADAWENLGPDAPAILTKTYIDENPYSAAERFRLERVPRISAYSLAHVRYHSGFVSVLREKGYHDVMLIDVAGNILYSAAKERDFTQNVLTGPLKSSNLGKLIKALYQKPDDPVLFSNFAAYEASRGTVASFAATLVRAPDGHTLGALVLQISSKQMEAILRRTHGDEITATSYLVDADRRLLSSMGGTPALQPLTGRSAAKVLDHALEVEHSINREPGLLGEPSILMTGHIERPGLQVLMVMEQSEAQENLVLQSLRKNMAFGALFTSAAMALLVFLLARGLAKPLVSSAQALRRIAGGDFGHTIVGADRKDEVGMIAQALLTVRDDLAKAAEDAKAAAFKGAAFASSSAALIIMTRDFHITFLNAPAEEILRRHEAEIAQGVKDFTARAAIGRGLELFYADPSPIETALLRNDPGPFQAEIKLGSNRIKLEISQVAMEGIGNIGFVLELRDVTDERMNRAVLGAIDKSLATAEFDAAGRVIKANGKLCSVLGVEPQGLIGAAHDVFLRYDDENGVQMGTVWARLMKGESVFGRFRAEIADGKSGVIDGGFSPVHDGEGMLLKVLFMGSDVTDAQLGLREAEEHRLRMERAQAGVVDALRVGLSELSEGDLTTRIAQEFLPEYEGLRDDFNRTVERLAEAMRTVTLSAAGIEEEVRDIAHASEDLSRRTESQAATLEQTAAALDELTLSVKSAATGASEANAVVTSARQSAEASGVIVREAVAAMGEIESSSEKIARIIGVIDDIAFQTNLLALNAGVEAARAGEAGRGFAVVANEVRALAQRSSEAAREIDVLISASSTLVRRGVSLVDQTGTALGDILGSVGHIAARMADIAGSAQEQSVGLVEINTAVNQIDHVTQQNAAMFGQAAVAGQRLKQGAETLTEMVARFRLPQQEPSVAQHPPARAVVAEGPRILRTAPPSNQAVALAMQPQVEKPLPDDWDEF